MRRGTQGRLLYIPGHQSAVIVETGTLNNVAVRPAAFPCPRASSEQAFAVATSMGVSVCFRSQRQYRRTDSPTSERKKRRGSLKERLETPISLPYSTEAILTLTRSPAANSRPLA